MTERRMQPISPPSARKPPSSQRAKSVPPTPALIAEAASGDLRLAAERVAAGWGNDAGDATDHDEVASILASLAKAITSARTVGTTAEADTPLRTPLGRRLLELLRADLIRRWAEAADAPAITDALETLRAIETVREAIEPDWDGYFASRLTQPDSLALVVEVAHDLRSPLTSILFLAETLQRGQSGTINDLQHRQLGLIYSAALGLSALASDVIELARGGNRLAEDRPVPFSITDILASVHDIVHPMAEEKGLAVRFLPPVPDERLGHPQALSRVLLNLTTNALKFTESGMVEIVAKSRNPGRVEFSVYDTGRGINPHALDTLYLPFRRSASRAGYTFSGTGLGLAICRRLVAAMGSQLEFETRSQWGTRFFFELELPPANSI